MHNFGAFFLSLGSSPFIKYAIMGYLKSSSDKPKLISKIPSLKYSN